jgi:hypothetical protein
MLIDLVQYFVQELQAQDLQHEVIVLVDANQDESQQYREQGHTTHYVTSKQLHVDGTVGGWLSPDVHEQLWLVKCTQRIPWRGCTQHAHAWLHTN